MDRILVIVIDAKIFVSRYHVTDDKQTWTILKNKQKNVTRCYELVFLSFFLFFFFASLLINLVHFDRLATRSCKSIFRPIRMRAENNSFQQDYKQKLLHNQLLFRYFLFAKYLCFSRQ